MNILEAIKSGRGVQTKCGYPVKVLTTEARSVYPIVGLAFDKLRDISIIWDKNGKSSAIGIDDFDLIVKPKRVTKWINIYNSELKGLYPGITLFDNERSATLEGKHTSNYVCTKSIEIEI